MSPRKHTVDATKGVLEIDWPFFGELSRGLALKVARAYDPDLVICIATAGVIPGAVIAAILSREFHSIVVSRRYRSAREREAPTIFGNAPAETRGKRVERRIPRCGLQLVAAAAAQHRLRETVVHVNGLIERRALGADAAQIGRGIGNALHAHHLSVTDFGPQAAANAAIRTDRLARRRAMVERAGFQTLPLHK